VRDLSVGEYMAFLRYMDEDARAQKRAAAKRKRR